MTRDFGHNAPKIPHSDESKHAWYAYCSMCARVANVTPQYEERRVTDANA